MSLLDYQKTHYNNILNILKKHSRALDASETGTGKTYISAKICKDLNLIPFVICPKSMKSDWLKILNEFGIRNRCIYSYTSLLFNKDIVEYDTDKNICKWKIDNNKLLNTDLSKFIFIYDEAHKCKNKDSANSKLLLDLSTYNTKIMLLSATIADKISYFLPFGLVLKLYKSLGDGTKWLENIYEKNKNHMIGIHKVLFNEYASKMTVSETKGIFKKNMIHFEGFQMNNYFEIELKYEHVAQIMNMKRKKAIKKEKKKEIDKINKNKVLGNEFDVEQIQSDEELVKEENELSEETEEEKVASKNVLLIKLRQEIELLKVDTIVKLTQQHIKNNKSVVIFVNFTETINQLCTRLNTNCIVWGSQSLEERNRNITNFTEDKERIIICNITSGGTGVSLHDKHGKYPRVTLISPTWSAQDFLQSMGRIHRALMKTDAEQFIVYCKNTVEENVGKVMKQKLENISALTTGKINIDFKNKDFQKMLKNNEHKKEEQIQKKKFMFETLNIDEIQKKLDYIEEKEKEYEYLLNKIPPENPKYEKFVTLQKVNNKEKEFFLNEIKKMMNLEYIDKAV